YRPFLLIGDGPCWAQAGPELEELINLAAIPFATRRLGRGVVPETHPYCCRSMPLRDMELMVSMGVKVGFFDGYGAGWPETIQIADAENHIWTYLPTRVAVLGNIKVVARQMIEYIKAHNLTPPPGREAWLQRIQEDAARSKRKRDEKALYYQEHPRYKKENIIHWGYLSKVVVDYLEEHYQSRNRIAIDGYTISDFIMPFITAVRPAQVLTSSEQAGVGHAVGMTIGAAIADIEATGDRTPLVAMMGDAGMGVAGTEIETAVKLRLPIVFIVTNNDGWVPSMKYTYYGQKYEAFGEQDQMGSRWLGALSTGIEKAPRIRWDDMCRAFGAYGETVDRHEDLPAALDRCFKAAEKGRPAVLNCMMDKTITNRAMLSPAYNVCLAFIPYEDLPERGKIFRRGTIGPLPHFTGLHETPDTPLPDFWAPVEDETGGDNGAVDAGRVITCPWCQSEFTWEQVKDRYEFADSPVYFCPNRECRALLSREEE
ncbi:MAG: thiamine pyrophosphate-dependent enzyme, partial [Bacillota bacterium]